MLLHDGLPWSRAADALPELIEGLDAEGFRLVTVSELLTDHALRRPSPVRRVLRRVGHRLGMDVGTGQAAPSDSYLGRQRRRAPRADGDRDGHLAELLQKVAEGVEAPEDGDPGTVSLIRGACLGLADRQTASDLLARNVAALEVNSIRVMALGFSLRRFEDTEEDAAPLPEEFSVRLRDASDPSVAAGLIAQELAGRMRVRRLVAARLSQRRRNSQTRLWTLAPSPHRRSSSRSSRRGPRYGRSSNRGRGRWDAGWRENGCRALLDAAGVDNAYEIERLIERLDVEYFFRFGYVLAACEEELARADS